jgi:hypothetical protein
MTQGLFQRINGKVGEVRIETLGVLVGTFQSWALSRRGDDGPGADLYDLRAVFSYVNPHLWEDTDYIKTITIKIGRDTFRLEQEDGYATQLDGRRSVYMQGVRLCQ